MSIAPGREPPLSSDKLVVRPSASNQLIVIACARRLSHFSERGLCHGPGTHTARVAANSPAKLLKFKDEIVFSSARLLPRYTILLVYKKVLEFQLSV